MLKRIFATFASNLRVVFLVITSLALVLGVVSALNHSNVTAPYIGLVAVEGKDFLHLSTDGGGTVERQSGIARRDRADLFEGGKQVVIRMEGLRALSDGGELEVSWSHSVYESGAQRLDYTLTRGDRAESWSEGFASYDLLFTKLAFDLGVGGTLAVTYQPQLLPSQGEFRTEQLSVGERSAPPEVTYIISLAVGFAFLALGFAVFFFGAKRRLVLAGHFHAVCLAAFATLACGFTIGTAPLSATLFWVNRAGFVFMPALLVHLFFRFASDHPERVLTKRSVSLFIVPAALIMADLIYFLFLGRPWRAPELPPISGAVAETLLRAEIVVSGGLILMGLVVLVRAYRSTDSVEKKLQLKWLFWGVTVGALPSVALYYPMKLLDASTRAVEMVSILPLIVMPLCLAYAVFRLKLIDVEILFKRGLIYFISSFSIVALYFLLMFFFTLFGNPGGFQAFAIISGAMILLATVFSHRIKNQVQSLLDRVLYRDFYNFRLALKGMSRELSYERDLDRLLEKISRRIRDTFHIPCLIIFMISPDRRHFMKACCSVENFGVNYLSAGTTEALAARLSSGNPLPLESCTSIAAAKPFEEIGLRVLIPFLSLGNVIGFIALGDKADGDILNTDDLELLTTLAGRAAVSIDNALLYQDLERRADELRSLKEFNESIVESVDSGICVVDREGRVRSWNNALEKMFAVQRAGALGRPLLELLPPPLPRLLGPWFQGDSPERGRGEDLYKIRVGGPNKSSRFLNISLVPMNRDGGTPGKVLIVDDTTDWVSLEEELVQRDKLASLGLMAAGVAHEVNTPLAGISSYVQILQKRFAGDPDSLTILQKVEKQAFRASRIMNSLLNFSRQGSAELSEIDLNALIGDSLLLVENQLESANVTVATDFAADLARIYGDRGKLQQVLINLLLNARDSMPHGGLIDIKTWAEGHTIKCRIADQGFGISEEILGRIFDPFFTTKKMGKGTGLGLAVSYGIIEEHSGTIDVESQVNVGTVFTLSLPAAPRITKGGQ